MTSPLRPDSAPRRATARAISAATAAGLSPDDLARFGTGFVTAADLRAAKEMVSERRIHGGDKRLSHALDRLASCVQRQSNAEAYAWRVETAQQAGLLGEDSALERAARQGRVSLSELVAFALTRVRPADSDAALTRRVDTALELARRDGRQHDGTAESIVAVSSGSVGLADARRYLDDGRAFSQAAARAEVLSSAAEVKPIAAALTDGTRSRATERVASRLDRILDAVLGFG